MAVVSTILFGKQIISMVGGDILLNTITYSASNIYSILTKLTRLREKNDITEYLMQSDLEKTLIVIDTLIKSMVNKKLSSPIRVAIQNLTDILAITEKELNDIHEKLEYNESLYVLRSWRSYDCTLNLDRIKQYAQLLDKRLDLVIKLFSINDNISDIDNNLYLNKSSII